MWVFFRVGNKRKETHLVHDNSASQRMLCNRYLLDLLKTNLDSSSKNETGKKKRKKRKQNKKWTKIDSFERKDGPVATAAKLSARAIPKSQILREASALTSKLLGFRSRCKTLATNENQSRLSNRALQTSMKQKNPWGRNVVKVETCTMKKAKETQPAHKETKHKTR